MSQSTCSVCGCKLDNPALYCMACYKKCLVPCPTCRDKATGKLLVKYRRHVGEAGKVCLHCERPHNDSRQLVCGTCKNERTVLRPPAAAQASDRQAPMEELPFAGD